MAMMRTRRVQLKSDDFLLWLVVQIFVSRFLSMVQCPAVASPKIRTIRSSVGSKRILLSTAPASYSSTTSYSQTERDPGVTYPRLESQHVQRKFVKRGGICISLSLIPAKKVISGGFG